MKVSADRGVCCGSGQCVMLVPDVFDQDDDEGIVLVKQPEPAEGLHAAVRDAAAVCPTGAITVHDD